MLEIDEYGYEEEDEMMECQKCMWSGSPGELVSSESSPDGPFNHCPDCGSIDLEDWI